MMEMARTTEQNTAPATTEMPTTVLVSNVGESVCEDGCISGLASKTETKSKINNWFMASVYSSSYGCTWKVAKHERSVEVAQGDS